MISIPLILVTLVLILPFSSLANATRYWWVRHVVLNALDQAASVQVIEHSDHIDIPGYNPNYQEKTYAAITLTPKQVEDLRQAMPFSLDFGEGILQCKFEEHHRIEIKRRDGTMTTLHLCFHCGQLYLNEKYEGSGTMPPGWPASLRKFMTSMGLHPDGPWPPNP